MRHDLNLRLGRLSIMGMLAIAALFPQAPASAALKATIGAYYFEGWWQVTLPNAQVTTSMMTGGAFAGRQPTFGGGVWQDDSVPVMQQQIDLAADHGVSFFSFDWYWDTNAYQTRYLDGYNAGLYNYLAASNSNRMKFTVNLCTDPTTTADWTSAINMLMPLFQDSRYQLVGGKPLVNVFDCANFTQAAHDALQTAAKAAGLTNGLAFALHQAAEPTSLSDYTARYNTPEGVNEGEVEQQYTTQTAYEESFWTKDKNSLSGSQKLIPTVIAGWESAAVEH